MNEKIYKTMSNTGVANLVLGICLIVVAAGMGVSMIIGGVKLLKEKAAVMF